MTNAQRVIVITGGHTGIGFELCKKILSDGDACLILLFRLKSANAGGAEELKNLASKSKNCSVQTVDCDCESNESIKAAAEVILKEHKSIQVLFNNAGYLATDHQTARNGLDRMWAINTVAAYHLSELLRPALKGGKIINTSSGAIYLTKNLSELDNGYKSPGLMGMYGLSKKALTAVVAGLALEYARDEIWICSQDPGGNSTNMVNDCTPWYLKCCLPIIFNPPTFGANLLYKAAFETSLPEYPSGCHISDGGKNDSAKVPADARDTERQRKIIERLKADIQRLG